MAHPVIHFEILGPDGPKLRAFYKDVFDWQFDEMPGMDYGMVSVPEGQPGIGGGIGSGDPAGGTPALVTVYIEVDDVQKYLDQAKANGGEIVQEVTEVPGAVTLGQFRDPQGNVVGLVKNEPPA